MGPGVFLRALAHRNYRLYFFGQGVSMIGTWMQQIAMSWLVFQMTQRSFWFGLVLFCGQIPALFLAPFSGVITDRLNRHRLLLLTQSLAMIQAFALAGMALTGVLALWHVVVLSLFIGVVNAFDMTARQAFLSEIVEDRADLPNAIALNSSIVNGARLLGPALGGLLLARIGAGGCFLLNGVSFLAVLAALLAMRVKPREIHHRPLLAGVIEGFRYAFGFAPIRALLLLMALTSLMGISYNVLLPAFTTERLRGDEQTLGWLMAASGVGSLAGALFLAARASVLGLGWWVMVTPALLGVALLGFALPPSLGLSLGLLVVIGFSIMIQLAATNSLLQTIVEEDKRGRVMSLYTTAFLGIAPIGSLLAGWLADEIGLVSTFLVSGLVCIAGAMVFAFHLPRLRHKVRPIYIELGILPTLVGSIPAADELSVPPPQSRA